MYLKPAPLLIFALLASLLALAPLKAYAVPPLPHSFYGAAKVGGQDMPAGSMIVARLKGTDLVVGYTYVSADYPGRYSLAVRGDDPDTPEKEGPADGEYVEIYARGPRSNLWLKEAEAAFRSGSMTELDLTARDAEPPSVTVDPVATPTNAPTQIISGSFSDAFIKEVRVERGGAVIAVAELPADGRWRATVSLQEGLNRLTVRAVDLAGNEGTASVEVVLDTVPPAISDVAVVDVTESSARITWRTDEPSTSQVEYGRTAAYGMLSPLDPTLATSHSVTLRGLSPGTTYHFRVVSVDAAGNRAYSSDYAFTTREVAPPRAPSSITCSVHPPEVTLGSSVVVRGSISPPHAAAVTIEVSRDGGLTWSVLATVASAADGSYSYVWTPPEPVTYMLRASWPGDADHYGATSGIAALRVTLRAFPPARIAVERLERGKPAFIDLRAVEPRLSVLYLNLTARVDVGRATITVEELVARPPDAPPPPHLLYRCINITTGLDPAAIASVTIGFRVNQSWIVENRINKTAVRLLRLHLGSWEPLPTSLVGEDASYAYYQAASPGLSIFAVVGEALPPLRPAEFKLSGLSISPGEVRPGEGVNVTVAVANVGDLAGEYVVTLRVNGTVEATKAVSLAGGASTTVSFVLVKAVPGAYVVEVDGLRGSFRVRAPRPAEFRLSNLSISPAEVEAGEPVSVSVEVRNVGEVEGACRVALKVNGTVEAARDVTLPGGASATVSFRLSREAAGTYVVEVDGLTGLFRVRAKAAPPPPWPLYVAVAVIIVAAVVIAAALIWRRRTRAAAGGTSLKPAPRAA